jgi:hypothetical protein
MALPQESDILGQGVIALLSDQAAQVLFVSGQACRHAPAVRFGFGRTDSSKVLPQFLDGFQMDLENFGNLNLGQFSGSTGGDNPAS